MIVPNHQLSHGAALEQHAPHELLWRERGELPVEPQEQHVVERELRQDLPPLGAGGEERGAARGFTTSSGCGSKVTSTLARPAAAARLVISRSTA